MRRHPSTGGTEQSKTYVYTNAKGDPLFRVVRKAGKKFHQERYVGGKWIAGRGEVEPVLYNLPAVADAAERHGTLWVCEGEKDADRLHALGVPSTTNPGGAGNWKREYSAQCVGVRRAIVCWDNDPKDPKTGKFPGQDHALKVEASLRSVGVAVRFARAREGNDVSDHLDAGHGLDAFVRERPGPPLRVNPEPETIAELEDKPPPAVFQLALARLREHAEANGLPRPRKTDRGWECCCPAHDDHSPSLGVRVGDDQPLVVSCQAGCELYEIAEALRIDVSEFSDRRPQYDVALEKEIQRQRVLSQARVIIAAEAAPPVALPTLTPDQYMSEEPPTFPYTIEELHLEGGNTLIVAAYKTGKTSLSINLLRSLVNVTPFLDRFEVQEPQGKVAYMDYEMIEEQFRGWLQDGGGINTSRMTTPWHLRGQVMAFWTKNVRERIVDWLGVNDVTTLIMDTAARAWSGLVENENSNSEILRFTDALDQLKAEAGVTDLFLVTHMGRQSPFMQEGEERSRGATRLEDWMDSGWYLTRDKAGSRFMRATGRGVDVDPMVLQFDPKTKRLWTSGVLKRDHDEREGVEKVVDATAAFGVPPKTAELKDILSGNTNQKQRWVFEAERRGLIERRKGDGPDKRSMYVHLTEAGLALHDRQVTVVKKTATNPDVNPDVAFD
jgi:AAA domain